MNSLKLVQLLMRIYSNTPPDLAEIESLGLLSVKISQYYALRPDFINESVCMHLSKLYEHSFPEKIQKIDDIIGKDSWILDGMKSYEEYPFSSASVGQVHTCYLKDGRKAVIKIERKDFESQFVSDVKSAKRIARILLFFYPKLKKVFNPLEALNNIEDSTLRELDFNNEVSGAQLLEKLKEENSEKFDLSRLAFSKFILNLCTKRVAVSEYIEGCSFSDLLDKKEMNYDDLLLLFKYHSFYMFKLGVFHGDLHPGNIILGSDGIIHLIDCSTIGRIKKKMQIGLFWFFYHLCRYDYEKAGFYLNRMSEVELKNKNYTDFMDKFKELYKDFKDKSVSQVSLTKKMMETIKLAVNSGMEFEEGMFHIIKSLMYLDGMVIRCKPDVNLMDDIRNFTSLLENDIPTSL